MNKRILRLALPAILANITIPLVGIVDTAIAGHIADASAIGGIAVGTMLFDLLYWNFGFLRVGTSGLTAQAYGREDAQTCSRMLHRSLRIALLSSVIILAIQWFFVTGVLMLVPCSEEVAAFARRYFFVRVWAAPATLALMALKGWFIGMQDTVSPMATDIVVNAVNMAASYLLAVHTPLGAVGVAYGTLAAQYTGLALALVILCIRYRHHLFAPSDTPTANQPSLFRLNANLFIRSLCFMVVYVGFTALASDYGDTQLAVASILMKLMMFFSFFADGFAYAGEALVGKYVGAGREQEITRVVRLLFAWSGAIGIAFTLFYAACGMNLMTLMTNDTTILQAAPPYLIWLILMPLVSTLAFMWDGIYIGTADGITVRNAMMAAAGGFVITYICLQSVMGIQALYLAYFIHLLARAIYLTVVWKNPLTVHGK